MMWKRQQLVKDRQLSAEIYKNINIKGNVELALKGVWWADRHIGKGVCWILLPSCFQIKRAANGDPLFFLKSLK